MFDNGGGGNIKTKDHKFYQGKLIKIWIQNGLTEVDYPCERNMAAKDYGLK